MIDSTATGPLAALAEQLKEVAGSKRDLMADTRRVSFSPHGLNTTTNRPSEVELLVDLGEDLVPLKVNRYAHTQVADHLGIQFKLYDRLLVDHPDLLADLANGLLSREPSKRLLRTVDGKLRAFLSDRYRPRDNWDLMEQAVLPVLGEHAGRVQFKKCDLTETRMYVKIVLPDFEMPVTPKVGDVIRGGVIIQNSEVGAGSLGIFPYTDRLLCLNGMVHTEMGQRSRHVGKRIESESEAWDVYSDATLALDDAAFFAKCSDTLRAVLNETIFEKIVGQMRDLAEIRVQGSPDKVVEVFASRNGLNDTEAGSMLTALIEGADLSAWGFVNAITRTARDIEDADRQTELETLAGRLVSNHDWALAAA